MVVWFLLACGAPPDPTEELAAFCAPSPDRLPLVEHTDRVLPYDPEIPTIDLFEGGGLPAMGGPDGPIRLRAHWGLDVERPVDVLHEFRRRGHREVRIAVRTPARAARFAEPSLAKYWLALPFTEREDWLARQWAAVGCPETDVSVCSGAGDILEWARGCSATVEHSLTLLQLKSVLPNRTEPARNVPGRDPSDWTVVAMAPGDLTIELGDRWGPTLPITDSRRNYDGIDWKGLVRQLQAIEGPIWPTRGVRSPESCEEAREAMATEGLANDVAAIEAHLKEVERAIAEFGGRVGAAEPLLVQTQQPQNLWVGTPEEPPRFVTEEGPYRIEVGPVGCAIYTVYPEGPEQGRLWLVRGDFDVRVWRADVEIGTKTLDLAWWPVQVGVSLPWVRHSFADDVRAHLVGLIRGLPAGADRLALVREFVRIYGHEEGRALSETMAFTADELVYTRTGMLEDHYVSGKTTILAPLPFSVRFETEDLPVTPLPFVHGRRNLRFGRAVLEGKGIGHLTLTAPGERFDDALLTFEPGSVLVLGDYHPMRFGAGTSTCLFTDIAMNQRCGYVEPELGAPLRPHIACYGRDDGWFPGVLRARDEGDERALVTILMASDPVRVTWTEGGWQAWFSKRSCDSPRGSGK